MLRAVIASGSPLGSKIKKVSVTLFVGVVCECTVRPAYNEYGYYEQSSVPPAVMSLPNLTT